MSIDWPTSRDRAQRVRDHGYHRNPTPLAARTVALSWLAVGVGGAVIAVAVFFPSASARHTSPGPLSAGHATWESRCDSCHVSGRPIAADRIGAGWLARKPGAADRCDTCHSRTPHFAGQTAEQNNCAGCHAEHRGRDARLTRPADPVCTGCHADLKTPHRATDFAADHPEFSAPRRFEEQHGRRLKFSHAVHLAPGMALAGADRPRPWTLADVPDPAARARYAREQGTEDLAERVRLDCRACHQFQSGDGGGGPAPDRSDGRFYAPVRFEAHCRGCHPLSASDDLRRPLIVPHGGTPEQLRQFLRQTFAAEFLAARPDLLDAPLPSPRLDRPPAADPTVRDALAARLAATERAIRTSGTGCALCHLTDESGAVAPVTAKQVWLERATFSHRAHRAAECRVCHAGVYAEPGPGAKLVELEPTHIGGLADCRRCHAPATVTDGTPRGGAGRSCTTCHTYHGTGRHRGPAAPEREPRPRLGLDDFLSGKRPGGR